MRKNLTEIVFILDRSGSMSGLEADTIGGFNSMIEKQKKENGEALISTVLFDNVSEVIHDRVPVQKVEPMTDKDYSVRGCTALLDAIGGAIHHIGNVHKYARIEDVPEHTLFVITTDGMENASRRYDSEKVKKMIERQKEMYKCSVAKDALMDVRVPEMIIKLKQGIGRLIRNFTDTGIVCIIDRRLRDEPPERYHDITWDSLPIKNRTSSLDELRKFYEGLPSAKE